jgi:ankyrin repeat protein
LIKANVDLSVLKNKVDQLLDEKGNTILHRALVMEYEFYDTFLKILNESNFLINTKDKNGNTLLHIVAEQDVSEFLAPVLAQGADTSVLNNEGLSPLDIAIRNESVQIVAQLVKSNPSPTEIEKIKSFVNSEGNTLLHRAVSVNSENAVKALLKIGIDVNSAPKDVDSYTDSGTPLHLGNADQLFY